MRKKLTLALWDEQQRTPRKPRPTQEVIEEIYGPEEETSEAAFRGLISDTRQTYQKWQLALDIKNDSGLVWLQLAFEINSAHHRVETALTEGLAHAKAAGELLIIAKEQIPHGQWLTFVAGCGLKARTAQRYMQISQHWGELEVSPHLSVSKAVKLLAHSEEKEQTEANTPRATHLPALRPGYRYALEGLTRFGEFAPGRWQCQGRPPSRPHSAHA